MVRDVLFFYERCQCRDFRGRVFSQVSLKRDLGLQNLCSLPCLIQVDVAGATELLMAGLAVAVLVAQVVGTRRVMTRAETSPTRTPITGLNLQARYSDEPVSVTDGYITTHTPGDGLAHSLKTGRHCVNLPICC